MYVSPSKALIGLLVTFIPSALGAPANGVNNTGIAEFTSTDTSPNLVDRSALAQAASPANLACYQKMKGCKYKDVNQEAAKGSAAGMCAMQAKKKTIAKPGWPGVSEWIRNQYWISYNMKIEWKEGCVAPGDGTMDVVNPGHGVSCRDILLMTWKNCNNGGRGGKLDYGCLTYHYNVINGDRAGPDYCINLPFDNSTIGGGS
ncbi:hypothetical protein diail_6328 [Diaporthe ilicicola]|nr:hypothetical protein diail_6328 [Diaporthe ilicicola]